MSLSIEIRLPPQVSQTNSYALGNVDESLQRARLNPRDELWQHLLHLTESDGITTAKSLEIYEAAIECFPNTPSLQLAYLKKIMSKNSLKTEQQLEDLLKLSLKTPSVEICALYISFIRNQRSVVTLMETYKSVLDLVGHEADSWFLWDQYIRLTEEIRGHIALREVLHEVVKIPMMNLPDFWELLEAYEHKYHESTAEETLAGLLPLYAKALRVHAEYLRHMRLLDPSPTPGPRQTTDKINSILPASPLSSVSVGQLMRRWEAYLRWEESDPLSLRERSMATYINRLRNVYVKAVVRLRFCPEVWYMAYKWWLSVGDADEGLLQLKMGVKANNDREAVSLLLNAALADALELRDEQDQARSLYQQLLSQLRTALFSRRDLVSIGDIAKDFGLAYIMRMRFEMRNKGLTAAWSVFHEAMEDAPVIPWLVFEEAAKIACSCTIRDRNDLAFIAFEAGMAHFASDIDYVICYLDWLISIDDRKRAQCLFESVIDTFSGEDAAQLWDRWSRYMYRTGDLDSIQEVEKRMARIYGLADLRLSLSLFSSASLTFTRNVTRKGRQAYAKGNTSLGAPR
ncbi:mRNA 3'-end-processing protein rna14 [Paramarasmius palmivorus]|uniref:mRNA 3'-end-processing protein RNA14 n=1 Tax=Paramarasmius palmivorus TaxID=297713 RepID=A0AAW0BDR8_9AGAR